MVCKIVGRSLVTVKHCHAAQQSVICCCRWLWRHPNAFL